MLNLQDELSSANRQPIKNSSQSDAMHFHASAAAALNVQTRTNCTQCPKAVSRLSASTNHFSNVSKFRLIIQSSR